jgi:hypothetical protein
MAMVRMFHVACDICNTDVDGDEWYASLAIQLAKDEGYHIGAGNKAICEECWESGKRWADIEED